MNPIANTEGADAVDGLFAIARTLDGVAFALKLLGNADACTNMGAIEAHMVAVRDGADRMAEAIDAVADAVADRVSP